MRHAAQGPLRLRLGPQLDIQPEDGASIDGDSSAAADNDARSVEHGAEAASVVECTAQASTSSHAPSVEPISYFSALQQRRQSRPPSNLGPLRARQSLECSEAGTCEGATAQTQATTAPLMVQTSAVNLSIALPEQTDVPILQPPPSPLTRLIRKLTVKTGPSGSNADSGPPSPLPSPRTVARLLSSFKASFSKRRPAKGSEHDRSPSPRARLQRDASNLSLDAGTAEQGSESGMSSPSDGSLSPLSATSSNISTHDLLRLYEERLLELERDGTFYQGILLLDGAAAPLPRRGVIPENGVVRAGSSSRTQRTQRLVRSNSGSGLGFAGTGRVEADTHPRARRFSAESGIYSARVNKGLNDSQPGTPRRSKGDDSPPKSKRAMHSPSIRKSPLRSPSRFSFAPRRRTHAVDLGQDVFNSAASSPAPRKKSLLGEASSSTVERSDNDTCAEIWGDPGPSDSVHEDGKTQQSTAAVGSSDSQQGSIRAGTVADLSDGMPVLPTIKTRPMQRSLAYPKKPNLHIKVPTRRLSASSSRGVRLSPLGMRSHVPSPPQVPKTDRPSLSPVRMGRVYRALSAIRRHRGSHRHRKLPEHIDPDAIDLAALWVSAVSRGAWVPHHFVKRAVRQVQGGVRKRVLRAMQIYFAPWLRHVVLIAAAMYLILGVFYTRDGTGAGRWELAAAVLSSCAFMFMLGLELYITGVRELFYHVREMPASAEKDAAFKKQIRVNFQAIFRAAACFVVIADVVVKVVRNSDALKVASLVCRPLLLLAAWPEVRAFSTMVFRSAFATRAMLEVQLLLLFLILFYANIGCQLFGAEWGNENFLHFGDGVVSMFVFTTGDNYPDVFQSTYVRSRASFLFFVTFQILAVYFLLNMLVPAFVNGMKTHWLLDFKTRLKKQRRMLMAAFTMVAGQRQYLSRAAFEALVRKAAESPSHASPMQVTAWFNALDKDGSGRLDAFEFIRVADVLSTAGSSPLMRAHRIGNFLTRRLVPSWLAVSAWQGRCRWLVEKTLFKHVVWITLVVQFVMFALVGYNNRFYSDTVLAVAIPVFLCVYWADLIVNSFMRGFPHAHLDGWLLFDLMSTLLSTILYALPNSLMPAGAARIVLLSRTCRLLQLYDQFPIMMGMFVRVLRQMAAFAVLIFGVTYIYAAIGTRIFADAPAFAMQPTYPVENFDSMWGSLLTLFQVIQGNNWWNILLTGQSVHRFAAWYFISFCYLAQLLLLNAIVGVMLDAYSHQQVLSADIPEPLTANREAARAVQGLLHHKRKMTIDDMMMPEEVVRSQKEATVYDEESVADTTKELRRLAMSHSRAHKSYKKSGKNVAKVAD